MNILQSLRERLRSRQHSVTSIYWEALQKVAESDKVSEKAGASLIAKLAEAAEQLARSPEQVDADLALMREHEALRPAEDDINTAQIDCQRAARAFVAADREATEMEQRAAKMRNEAETLRQSTRGQLGSLAHQVQELASVRRKLAAAGHPESVAHTQCSGAKAADESLRTEIREIDSRLKSLGKPEDDRAGISGARIAGERATLVARRSEVEEKLAKRANQAGKAQEVAHA